ncbi:MAG: GNAT family N-acetyltransferase [Trueperaceae bacterium]
MNQSASTSSTAALSLQPVNSENWRDIAKLTVTEAQRDFITTSTYYLALCCYDPTGWQPLALNLGDRVIGFLMWAVDPDDGSCWLGGVLVDRAFQGRGHGRNMVRMVLSKLADEHGFQQFALSYEPTNLTAKRLYADIGFTETGERAEDEVVARLSIADPE